MVDVINICNQCPQVGCVENLPSDEIVFTECNKTNCSNPGDCGNKYFYVDVQFHLQKTVVTDKFIGCKLKDRIYGVMVRRGESIPQRGIIGEYVGKMGEIKKSSDEAEKLNDSDSINSGETYQFEVGKTLVNAEKEVNSLWYVNHRCENENVVAIAVNINGTDRFFRALRKIKGGELLSVDCGKITESLIVVFVMSVGTTSQEEKSQRPKNKYHSQPDII